MGDKTKHTPGPWRATPHNQVISPKGRVICFVNGEGEANAHLIAAAPELLAALEMVMAKYSKHLDNFAFEQCHSAITKAMG